MDNINYPDNSHAAKRKAANPTPEKEVKKVVTAPVKIKKNEIKKFTDVFLSEDISSVGSYIFTDVIVPAIKDTMVDILTKGAKMIFYGSKGAPDKDRLGASRVSYRSYYDERNRTGSSEPAQKSKFDYEDVEFTNRSDAEDVLDQMDAMLEQYKKVSVLDFYDMIDVTAPFTSEKYGWTNLRDAKVVPTKGGYKLKLPRAITLD